MAHSAPADALAARKHLESHGWIPKRAEAFRHLPPPPAALWLGEGVQPAAAAPQDGWSLQTLPGTTTGAVQARWFDLADAAQRAELFEALPAPGDDEAAPFAWAHRALVRTALRLRVGAGESFLRLDRLAAGPVEAPMLVVELAPGASCVLLESHALPEGAGTVQNLQVHLRLAPGSRLQHLRHVAARNGARIAHQLHAALEEQAQYAQALLATGSDYHLQRTVLDLRGAGAAGQVGAVLMAAGNALDQQVLARHGAPRTSSGAEMMALASGAARVIGNALSHIAAGSDEANVRQKLAGIPTAGQPRIVLRPHLEIHHDQVQASHGATWGSLPEEALFFARQRGLDDAAAHALILEGLARSVLARSVDDSVLPEALRLDDLLAADVAQHLAAATIRETAHG